MGNFYNELANYLVTPTEADHHGDDYTAGTGLVVLEPLWTLTRYAQGCSVNRVISGFTLPSTGDQAHATITAGSAVVAGYLIKGTDNITEISFAGSATSYVYLSLVVPPDPGDEVSQPVIRIETTRLTTPDLNRYYLFLGTVTHNGTNITTSNPQQSMGKMVYGAISAASTIGNYGSGDWTVSGTTITFTLPFIKTPAILVTPYSGGTSDYFLAQVSAKSASAFTAQSYSYSAGSWLATNAFEFVAIG